MRSIENINNVLFAFVLFFQILEGILAYSSTVYGKKELKNKYLIWLVVHIGFLGMFMVTRGFIILLYCLFIYLCCSCIYTFWFSIGLLAFYLCKVTNGKNY